MHTSWIGAMLGSFLMLLVLTNMIHGKALLEGAPAEGQHDYYSEIRNRYQPIYDHRSYAANPKLVYTPQIDGQPIYIPAISGSEHVNKFLDQYYKINRDYTQSLTLAPPVTYDYDISSESSYYENGVTANSMVKTFLEEKYKDGAYSSYALPATPGNLPKQKIKAIDHMKGIEHKDSGNKKTNKKKRPHVSHTHYKIKTEIPEDSSTVLIEADYKKLEDKSPILVKSAISEVEDYDERDQTSAFELKEDKTKDYKQIKSKTDHSKVAKGEKPSKKDTKLQSVKRKNKPKSEHVSKSYVDDYITKSPNLKLSKKEKTAETSKYSPNKIKHKVSVDKNKPEVDEIKFSDDDYEPEVVDVINEDDYEPEVVDVINKLSDPDYEPEVVDVINEDDYEPEVVNVINKLSDPDYEPEIEVNELSNDDYQQDVDVIKIPQTKKHFKTDPKDYDSNNKDNKKINSSVYAKVKNEKPEKGKHQSVKISKKPNKHIVKDVKDPVPDYVKLYKPEKIVQSQKDDSKKTKNKMPADSYVTDVVDEVNKLSDDYYEQEAENEIELSDDYEPEVVDKVNKLSDDHLETEIEDADELSDIDDLDPEADIVNEENKLETHKSETHLGNDETVILDTFDSKKDKTKPGKPVKTKPGKPVKTKPGKPVKTKPGKPVKTKGHNKNTDKYENGSEIKSTILKEIKPPIIETKDESKQKYESDGHIIQEKDQDALIVQSVIENQTDDLEINSRDLLNQPADIPNEFEEFDGSGSQAIDTSMRRIPQFFKNIESIRNLTSLNSNIWSLIFNPNAERSEPKRCVTRSNETGICTYVQQCEVPNIATSLEQLLNNACVIDDIFIGVCCPEFPVQTVKVHWDEMPSNSDKQSEDEFGHSVDDCGIRSDDAKKTESWPWQAPLVAMSNGKIFCGGVIINDDYILTAAHCTTKIPKNQILVRVGQHDETSGDDFAVVEIKRHAQYNSRTMHNDIALLKLGKRISRDKHTDAVCLPEDDDEDDHEDEKAVLLGRKGSFSNSKQTEWLKVISNEDCEKKLGSKVPATLLCTDARDENERTCNLDSGAPLVAEDDGKYEVIGILSWNRNDCDERFPSTFSRVSKYVRWIQKHAV